MNTDESSTLSLKKRTPKFLGAGLAAIMNPPEEMFPASAASSPAVFTLVYDLPPGEDRSVATERLGAAGLTDALVGGGESGRIALQFERVGRRLLPAVDDAIARVTLAHPGLLMRSIR